jgi:hypothetical protein
MFTATGEGFDLLGDKKPNLADISRALGMQCRFNGHLKHFYSVAQHCVNVVKLLRMRGYGPDVQLAGLLHDAGEAYVGDLTAPVQRVIDAKQFKILEAGILGLVHEVAGLFTDVGMDHHVHAADKDMGRIEIYWLMRNDHGMIEYTDLKQHELDLLQYYTPMSPDDCASLWEVYYDRIQEARQEPANVK